MTADPTTFGSCRTAEVSLDEMDAGASALAGCGQGLTAIDLRPAVEHLPPLLPGAATASAAVKAAARLGAAVAITAERLTELARLTRASAANYRAADEDAARAFTALMGP